LAEGVTGIARLHALVAEQFGEHADAGFCGPVRRCSTFSRRRRPRRVGRPLSWHFRTAS